MTATSGSVGPVRVADGVHVAAAPMARLDTAAGAAESDLREVAGMPPVRSAEYLAGRVLLRRLLAEVAGADAAGEAVGVRPRGQPWLPGRPDLGISVSHTRGWVAAAVATGRAVGVDVEAPRSVHPQLLRRCCTEAGLAVLDALPEAERMVEFAWIWTVQEGCVKAAGTGIAGEPWRIPVQPGQRAGHWDGYAWRALRGHFPLPVACAYGTTSRSTDLGPGPPGWDQRA